MKSISTSLKSLEAAGYLRIKPTEGLEKSVQSIELLANGKIYCDQLRRQWLTARSASYTLNDVTMLLTAKDLNSRLSFVRTQQFREQLKQLRSQYEAKCPTVARHQELCAPATVTNGPLAYATPVTRLVTDFFVYAGRGLEHFYKIQRESKIWWMRYSSNPSRYFMEPYELNAQTEGAAFTTHCQSITIKSKLLDCAVAVEQLTMLPLQVAMLQPNEDYQLQDLRTDKNILPTVIRSTIELEAATCALLLDAYDHNRNHTLLLNRKLAPFQCIIAYLLDKDASQELCAELKDLCAHLTHVLQGAGLRLASNKHKRIAGAQHLQEELKNIDSLGVPYTLLIDHLTTKNGLCRLRSRDTTLAETIHISDIPEYLLNIFAST